MIYATLLPLLYPIKRILPNSPRLRLLVEFQHFCIIYITLLEVNTLTLLRTAARQMHRYEVLLGYSVFLRVILLDLILDLIRQ